MKNKIEYTDGPDDIHISFENPIFLPQIELTPEGIEKFRLMVGGMEYTDSPKEVGISFENPIILPRFEPTPEGIRAFGESRKKAEYTESEGIKELVKKKAADAYAPAEA